jgi:hypothetical protein
MQLSNAQQTNAAQQRASDDAAQQRATNECSSATRIK